MIGQILTDIVLGNTTLKNMIAYQQGGNTKYAFFPNAVPQGVPLPSIAYKVLSIDSVDTKDDFSGIDKYRVQVDLFSGNYGMINKMDGAMRSAMNKAEGIFTVTDFDDSEVQVDVGVSRHDETTDIFFEEAETHGRSTEYFIITNRTS